MAFGPLPLLDFDETHKSAAPPGEAAETTQPPTPPELVASALIALFESLGLLLNPSLLPAFLALISELCFEAFDAIIASTSCPTPCWC